MSDPHPLLIPKDKLAGMKSWRPGSLAERQAGAERRAANQPTTAQTAAAASAGASPANTAVNTARPAPSPAPPSEAQTELSVINAARDALVEEATRLDADRANARRAGFAEGFEVGYAEGKSQADVHAKRLDTLADSVQAAIAAFEQDVSD
ncbi:MAG: hypothetical protein ABIU95_00235, partial [Burkholderiales bacterium]